MMRPGWIAAFAALGLAACAVTPLAYGPITPDGSHYGYRDTQNPDGSYTILLVTNNAALAQAFWDRRAAELCNGASVQKNIFRAQRPVYQYTGYATNGYGGGGSYTESRYGDFFLEGYLRCGDAETAATETADAAPDAAAAETAAVSESGEP
ncbi:MAG: hypothetical protein GC189_06785 [Alphaproteobacteria bacterium]|nr:hypothetical protein [Alphaproteobacteria bacterium]